MKIENRIKAFDYLGKYLSALIANDMKALPESDLQQWSDNITEIQTIEKKLLDYYEFAHHYNPWFIQEFVLFALKDWAKALQGQALHNWIEPYSLNETNDIKTIGVVMAGNLPIVGFHDYLSVLMSGHKLLAKLSSDDAILLPLLHQLLGVFEPSFVEMASFTKDQLKDFDAIIATGSNNTSRYFEYYFGKYPNIIRKNRSGVAVLTGKESIAELENLGTDIMAYFGLGCRSVSKLYVPKGYEFRPLFETLEKHQYLANHHKFFNNYEYNKAIFLVNRVMHRDTGFLLFKEDVGMSSPISVIYYEEYTDEQQLKETLKIRQEEIQCVLGKNEEIPLGQSQHPQLNDYADNIDTMLFLRDL